MTKMMKLHTPVEYGVVVKGRIQRRLGVTEVEVPAPTTASAPLVSRSRLVAHAEGVRDERGHDGRVFRRTDARDRGLDGASVMLGRMDPDIWNKIILKNNAQMFVQGRQIYWMNALQHPFQPTAKAHNGNYDAFEIELDEPFRSDAPEFHARAAIVRKNAARHRVINETLWEPTTGDMFELVTGGYAQGNGAHMKWPVDKPSSYMGYSRLFMPAEFEWATAAARKIWPDIDVGRPSVDILDPSAYRFPAAAAALLDDAWSFTSASANSNIGAMNRGYVGAALDLRDLFARTFPERTFAWQLPGHVRQWHPDPVDIIDPIDASPFIEPLLNMARNWRHELVRDTRIHIELVVERLRNDMEKRLTAAPAPTPEDDDAILAMSPGP